MLHAHDVTRDYESHSGIDSCKILSELMKAVMNGT